MSIFYNQRLKLLIRDKNEAILPLSVISFIKLNPIEIICLLIRSDNTFIESRWNISINCIFANAVRICLIVQSNRGDLVELELKIKVLALVNNLLDLSQSP